MRVLVVENDPEWWEELSQVAHAAIHNDVECVWAASVETAHAQIEQKSFGLILSDLSIPSRDGAADESPDNGMSLLQQIRSNKLNRESVGIVVTSHGTSARMREVLIKLDFSDFLDKDKFDRKEAQEITRAALFASAYARTVAMQSAKFDLMVVLTDTHVVFGQLSGPNRFRDVIPDDPWSFKAELTTAADRVNLFVSSEMRLQTLNEWREKARGIGQELYASLFHNSPFSELLAAARNVSSQLSDLRLCFRGIRTSLGIPFELLHDDDDFLAFKHPIFRQTSLGQSAARKATSFYKWLKRLNDQGETLQVLLIASNVGPRIDAVDDEVTQLESRLNRRLGEAGIRKRIVAVRSAEATYSHIETLLQSEKWHIIHYAGHGRWDDGLPENSDLMFQQGTGRRPMPASALYGLLQNSPTLLFYVSGCLGALMDDRKGRGDFHGLMDGIVQADVPIVLAHRWGVSDAAARDLALSFYDNLFASWSVEDALFSARQALIRTSPYHRDDPGWASPILVAQTAYYKG